MASAVEIAQGASVVDASGRAVGRIIAVEYEHIVVEQGFLFTRTLYLPMSAVARVEGASAKGHGRVHLNISGKRVAAIGKNDTFKEERAFIGMGVEHARFANTLPTATAGLNPRLHTADDFAAPSSYGDPHNGGDLSTADVTHEGVPTLHGNAPDAQTVAEQPQVARRPAKQQ
ncbi:MAG: hypothetical protein LC793_15950 [Thermomicrobia bacterium]|nr:hypothetical protein [Thermomicrobia bacterium]MCA1723048.1 hypothetical protein [Thermomicrobia bacterium]